MCLKKRVGGKSSLILIREQGVFSLLRELKIYHDICWLHSQNLSTPTTLEARQDSSVGAASSADAGLIRQVRDPSEAEGTFSGGPSLCAVMGKFALISPHKNFKKSIVLFSSWSWWSRF